MRTCCMLEPVTSAFLTLGAPVTAQVEVKRSKFLATVAPVADEASARALVEEARRDHWDARHHCSAFILGPARQIERSNDDGEPSGTAGAPMLEVLRGHELSDVCAVVTRWFGGTLLGAGGLVRAYGDAVRAALADAPVVRRELLGVYEVRLPYTLAARVENELRARGLAVFEVIHDAEATLRLGLRDNEVESASGVVLSASGGSALLNRVGEDWT